MAILGPLLRAQRNRDEASAWNRPNLRGPESISLTSSTFIDGGPIPQVHSGKRAGGANLSPELAWNALPVAARGLLLVVEDLDVPAPKPFVHCLAWIDSSELDEANHVPEGGLSGSETATGVTVFRSTAALGYYGPEPLKGHGPHRYAFQLFGFTEATLTSPEGASLLQEKPRDVLDRVALSVVARGRLTGTYER